MRVKKIRGREFTWMNRGDMDKKKAEEEEVDAPSAAIMNGFRLPSLRDCAGMTGGVGVVRE